MWLVDAGADQGVHISGRIEHRMKRRKKHNRQMNGQVAFQPNCQIQIPNALWLLCGGFTQKDCPDLENLVRDPNQPAMALSVREKQLEVVRRMLNFNTDPPPPNKSGTPSPAFGVSQLDSAKTSIWKILIYDRHGRDIISPLMKVGDLRQHGITIHALIDSDRQAVQDAPAIYFVMPTEENIRTIISDIENRLYETFHINFVSTIPTALLHTFAEAVAKSDCVSLVPKVFDQYCDFMALEGKLFSLGLSGSYSNFHNLKLSESDAKRNSQLVVDGLFAVLATMGTLPIIRCSRNDAAEMVGTMLDDKLRKHMKSHNHLFPENSIRQQRPVLLILDRDTDLNVALHHSWTYQALIHDVLDLKLNKVTFQAPESNAHSSAPPRRVMKTFDFDSHDIFWRDNAGLPFPKAAENVEKFVAEYKEQFDQLALLQASSDDAAATAEIAARIKSLPETTERKRQIDMHTLIATVILDKVKERRLDEFFMMEESILIKGSIDKKKLMSMVQDPAYGLPQDRMRLFLMYYLSNDLTQDEYDACVAALAKSGCDTSPSEYIKQLKRMKSFSADRMAMASSSSSSVSKKTQAIQEGLATFIMGGIQSILPVNKDLAVTRIVDAVMDLKSTPETDNLLYLDPKMTAGASELLPRNKSAFKDAIVFVVGGGNYVEYQNLQDYAKRQQVPKNIIYGSTEVFNSSEFVRQLEILGHQPK